MYESRLRTITEIKQFLAGTGQVEFTPLAGNDGERYEHISGVLKRFDYPRRGRSEKGVLRVYLRHTIHPATKY